MRKFDITVPIVESTYDELPAADRALAEAARKATYGAYSPYSHFNVGAAVRLADGKVFTGANQENAAFSSGTCAERSACFYAAANNPGVPFERIAIAARGTDGEFLKNPISPCGHCRQALLEYETLAGHDVPVILCAADKVWTAPSVKSLLPLAFTDF